MTDNELIGLFQEALHEVAPTRKDDFANITLETQLKELNLDSVTAMEMVGAVEERTGVAFPDDELAQLSSCGDLARLIRNAKG